MSYGILYFRDIDEYITACQRCIRNGLTFEGCSLSKQTNGFWYTLEIIQEVK